MRFEIQSDNIKDALAEAELDWTVTGRPLFSQDPSMNIPTFEPVESHKAVTRDDTGGVLGVVGKDYEILQNHEVFDFVDELQAGGAVKIHSAGSFKDGRVVFVQAEVGETEILTGDVHKQYLLFSNTFDGSSAVRIGTVDVRVVCENTLVFANKEAAKNGFAIRHTSSMNERIEAAKTALLAARSEHLKMEAFQRALAGMQMSKDDTLFMMASLVNMDAKNGYANAMHLADLAEHGIGQDIAGVAGTGYAALHAVTEYVSHEKPVRGEDKDEARDYASLMGSGATMVNHAVSFLNDVMTARGVQV